MQLRHAINNMNAYTNLKAMQYAYSVSRHHVETARLIYSNTLYY